MCPFCETYTYTNTQVFAPVNDAFNDLHPNVAAYLTSPEGAQDLVNVLAYHVVEGVIPSTVAINLWRARVPTLSGQDLVVFGYPNAGVVQVNRGTVVGPDVLANNGIIHAIDKVLIPPYLRWTVYSLSRGKKKRTITYKKSKVLCTCLSCIFVKPLTRTHLSLSSSCSSSSFPTTIEKYYYKSRSSKSSMMSKKKSGMKKSKKSGRGKYSMMWKNKSRSGKSSSKMWKNKSGMMMSSKS